LFLALQILAMGSFFSSIGGINPYLATIIGGLIIIVYTSIGGLRADIRTDVFQFIVMLVLLVIFLPMAFFKAGGFSAMANLPVSFLTGAEFAPPYVYLLAFLFLGVGAITSAEIWQRAYAADNKQNASWAFKISSLFIAAFLAMAVLTGIFGKILLPQADANLIVPELLKIVLPTGLFGIVIAGFLAAIMSTADTVLLIASMTIVHDFYHQTFKKELTVEKIFKISRWVTLSLGVISIVVSLIVFSITHLAIEAVSFYVVLAPAIIFGFYWKNASESSAFWSIVAGFLTIVTFLFIDPIQAFIPGLIISFIVFFIVNSFKRKSSLISSETSRNE
jgi:SSS family solute:Na+ symporter